MNLLTYFLIIAMSVSLTASAYAQSFEHDHCNHEYIYNDDATLQTLKECEDKADAKELRNTLYVLGGIVVLGIAIYALTTDYSEASLMESAHSLLDEKMMPKVSYDADTKTTHFGWTIPLGEQ